MTNQQINYVLVLSEERSFSKAAEKLFISQPALSQFIKNLEKEVGAILFDRSTVPLTITPAGEVYVKVAREIFLMEQELHHKIADIEDLSTGRFVLGSSSFRASCLLPRSVFNFKNKYPGIEVEMVTDHIKNLKDALLEGIIDFCIEVDDFDPTIFQCEELFIENYYLAVPKDHPFNNGREDMVLTEKDIMEDSKKLYTAKSISSDDYADLQELPFIGMKAGGSFYNTTESIKKEMEFKPEKVLKASQIEAAFGWVNSGLASGIVPDTIIRYGNYMKHPCYYRILNGKATRPIVVAYKKNRYVTHAMKAYIQLLKELISVGTWSKIY